MRSINSYQANRGTSAEARRILSFVFVLSFLVPMGLSAEPVLLTPDMKAQNITADLLFIPEGGAPASIDDINREQTRWTEAGSDYINFGYRSGAVWFKLNLHNRNADSLSPLLEIDFPTLDYIDLYRPRPGGGYGLLKTGDRLPFSSRELADPNYLFHLNIPPGLSTLYMRIQTSGSFRFRAYILPPGVHLERKNKQLPLLWLIYGMILLTVVFYLFFFTIARDRVYLYFSLFSSLMLLFQVAHRGYAFQFLWPDFPGWTNASPPVILNLLVASGALFLRAAMNTRETTRFIDRPMAVSGCVLFPAAAALSVLLPAGVALPATYYLVMCFSILSIIATIYYLAKGNRIARYLLAGMVSVGIFGIIGALTALGKMPSNIFTEWTMEAGIFSLILFSSLGLVDRVQDLNSALVISKKEIEKKNEMYGLKNRDLEAANEELQATLEELEATNEELQATMEELEATNEEYEAQNEELVRSQEELSASEHELKDVFNGAHDAFIIHDRDGRIIDVNDSMLEMYRLGRDQALTLNISGLTSPDFDTTPAAGYWNRTIAGENPVFEWKSRRPINGTEFDVEVGLKKLVRGGETLILASVRDITFRKEAERAVRESERQFRAIFENAPYGIAIIRFDDLVFIAVNPAFEKNAGYRADEVLGKNIQETGLISAPGDFAKILDPLLRDGFVEGVKIVMKLKNGETNTVLLSSRVFTVDNCKYILNFTVNITTLDLLKKALEHSEERFRLLIESSPLPIVLARKGKILYHNTAFSNTIGLDPRTDVVGSGLLEFIAPEERERVIGFMTARSEGEDAPTSYESTGIKSDGTRFPYEINIATVNLPDGPATLAFIQDITERKKAEAALAETLDTLRKSQEIASLGNWLYDIETQTFSSSDEGRRIWGFPPGYDPTLDEISRRIHPEDREKTGVAFMRAIGEGLDYSVEYRINRRDTKEQRYILSMGELQKDAHGNPAFIIGINQDITEQRKAQEEKNRMQAQLLQAQKLEAVWTLAGGIAHDFNNMLGGIMGSLNLLELFLQKEEPPAAETLLKYVETAMDSSRRAADITKQLLTLSRKSELKLVPLDVNLSMKHVIKICQNSFPKSIELEYKSGDSPLRIFADPVQIEQVILNLCVNASHAMTIMRPEGERQGGVLSLQADTVHFGRELRVHHPDARRDESYARLIIKDNGVGIDDKTLPQIFDPFFTTKTKEEGTGLGLAMSYGIVKQHGGFIDVDSEPGRGTVFSVYMPLIKDQHAERGRSSGRVPIVQGTGTILVIDDERSILSIARGMLEQCGYQVLTADSGDEGLKIFRENMQIIDGVLLDLSMPGISGMEVFEIMKAIKPQVRVLIASGLIEEQCLEKALSMGVKSFLQKPYSAEELSSSVKKILR